MERALTLMILPSGVGTVIIRPGEVPSGTMKTNFLLPPLVLGRGGMPWPGGGGEANMTGKGQHDEQAGHRERLQLDCSPMNSGLTMSG